MLGTQFQVSAQVVKTAVEVQQTIPELLLSQQGLGQLIDISA